MRTDSRRVFPLFVLLIAMTIPGSPPAAAREATDGPRSSAQGTAIEQGRLDRQGHKERAKFVVDCDHKRSRKSDNRKVRKFCRRHERSINGQDSPKGSDQRTLNCGTVTFNVDDVGGGQALFSFYGESTMGSVLGGKWLIEWKNNSTEREGTRPGDFNPEPGNPNVFTDAFGQNTGRGRVTSWFDGFLFTTEAFCVIFPPLQVEETVLR